MTIEDGDPAEPGDLSAGELTEGQKSQDKLLLEDTGRRIFWKKVVFWSSLGTIFVFYLLAISTVAYWVFCNPPYHLELEHGLIIALLLATASLIAIHVFKLVDDQAKVSKSDLSSIPAAKLIEEIVGIVRKVFKP